MGRVGALVAVPVEVHFQAGQVGGEGFDHHALAGQATGQGGRQGEQQVGVLHGADGRLVVLAAQADMAPVALPGQAEIFQARAFAAGRHQHMLGRQVAGQVHVIGQLVALTHHHHQRAAEDRHMLDGFRQGQHHVAGQIQPAAGQLRSHLLSADSE